MPFPWTILISFVVLGLAYLIKHFLSSVIEEEKVFLGIVAVFLVIYIGAAIAIGSLNPIILVNQGYLAANG
jgi:hypothetical protein